MSFDIGDRSRINIGQSLRRGDRFSLSVDARGSKTGFSRSVVVDGCSADDRMDRVPVSERIAQTLENDYARAGTTACATRVRYRNGRQWPSGDIIIPSSNI